MDTPAQTGGLRFGEAKMGAGSSLKKELKGCNRGGLRWSPGEGNVYFSKATLSFFFSKASKSDKYQLYSYIAMGLAYFSNACSNKKQNYDNLLSKKFLRIYNS